MRTYGTYLLSFSFVYFLMGWWGGDCKHHVMAWEYITKAKIHGFSKRRSFGGFGLLLLLPRLVVARVATTGCWFGQFFAIREMLFLLFLSME